AAFPGATSTSSSKTATMRAGAAASTTRSRGVVRTRFACADALAGATTAAAATTAVTRPALCTLPMMTGQMMTGHAGSLDRVIFRQFVDDDLGCGSYLVGDEHEGAAVVVDPVYAIEQYLEEASARGVTITGALETHTHADHVSGHGRLALDHGCSV